MLVVSLAITVLVPATEALAASPTSTDHRITHLEDEVAHLKTVVTITSTLFLGILGFGGVVSLVFSFRDQRRTSQMHELSVSAEVSSQRRTEQTYATFLEQSQTTLSLVNDTLDMAKQATDRAAHTMEIKAKSRLKEVEARSEDLMLRAFAAGQFEAIVDDVAQRDGIGVIAKDLQNLEGYIGLQDIALPPYTTFVKAIAQFLDDDVSGALEVLRRASQDVVGGDLRRFTLYWIGYMLTTIGEYDEAIRVFRDDEVALARADSEHHQLERMVAETSFFRIAKHAALRARAVTSSPAGAPALDGPSERLARVGAILADLGDLAQRVRASDDEHARRTGLAVARTRGDIYAWIAYDHARLDEPLEPSSVARASQVVLESEDKRSFALLAERLRPAPSLPDDAVRAWALRQARAICEAEPEPDFFVLMARAECGFALTENGTEDLYHEVERKLAGEFGKHREPRHTAELRQCALICHGRLFTFVDPSDKSRREGEKRQVRQLERDARVAVRDIRQPNVTVFSHLQRRNLIQAELRQEIEDVVEQIRLDDDDER